MVEKVGGGDGNFFLSMMMMMMVVVLMPIITIVMVIMVVMMQVDTGSEERNWLSLSKRPGQRGSKSLAAQQRFYELSIF